MALSSTSTLAEIKAAYIDNAMYDVNGSVSQAGLFLQACRILMLLMPSMASNDRVSLSLSPTLIDKQIDQVTMFLNTRGGGVRFFSTQNFRGAPTSPGILNPDPGGSP